MERGDPGAWFDSKAVAKNYELVLVDTGVAGGGRSGRKTYLSHADAVEAAGLRK
jgi:hypothetical protein